MGASDNHEKAARFAERSNTTSPLTENPTNNDIDDNDDQDAEHDSDNVGASKPKAPMQKRRRVTRACDECRRYATHARLREEFLLIARKQENKMRWQAALHSLPSL